MTTELKQCLFCEHIISDKTTLFCRQCNETIKNIQISETNIKLKVLQLKIALKHKNKDLVLNAAYYLYVAYHQGYFQTLVFIAIIFFSGILKKINFKLAFHFLDKGILKNDLNAYFLLANCYYDGYGIEKNTEKAMDLWSIAALKGHSNSELILLGKIPTLFSVAGFGFYIDS